MTANRTGKPRFLGLVISVIFLIISACFIVTSLLNKQKYVGWYVSVGDELGYAIIESENSSLHTIVDEIYEEYKFSYLEEDSFGDEIFTIRIVHLPEQIVISSFVRAILDFNAPITVERIFEGHEFPIHNNTLPFAMPVGYWDEVIEEFNKSIIGLVNYSYEIVDLTNEISFNITFVKSGLTYSLWIVWDLHKGTLEAMIISIEGNNQHDYLHIALAKLKIQRDYSAESALRVLGSIAVLFIFVASVMSVTYFIFSYLKYKREVVFGKYFEETSGFSVSKLVQLREMIQTYKKLLMFAIVINHALGLLLFPIFIKFEVKTKIASFALVFGVIFVPIIAGSLLDYYSGLEFGDNMRILFLSFINGIVLWFVSMLILSGYFSAMHIVFTTILLVLAVFILYVIKTTYNYNLGKIKNKYQVDS